MVTNKKFLLESINKKKEDQMADMEASIETAIRERYDADGVVIKVNLGPERKFCVAAKEGIKKAYEEAEWQVKFTSDRDDNLWVDLW